MTHEQEMAVRFICAFALLLLFTVPRGVHRYRVKMERDEQRRLNFARNLTPKKSLFTK